MAGFEPFSSPRMWDMDCPSPSHRQKPMLAQTGVSLGHVHPTFCQWKADKSSLWLTHLYLQEEGISLHHMLSDLSLKYPWARHWLLPCSKSNISSVPWSVPGTLVQMQTLCLFVGSYITACREGTSSESEILTEQEHSWQKASQQDPTSHLERWKAYCFWQRLFWTSGLWKQ